MIMITITVILKVTDYDYDYFPKVQITTAIPEIFLY